MRGPSRVLLLLSACAAAGCAAGAFQPRATDVPALEREAALAPADAEVLTRLGAAYHAAGRHEDARRVLRRATDAGAAAGAAWLYLGLASEALGDWSGARAAYEAYLRQGTSSRVRSQLRGRLIIVGRNELRQLAREALAREAVLSQQPPTPNTIAVMPFAITGLPDELAPLRTALADMIITDLGFTPVRSVERVRMQSMIDEMVLTQAGYTTPETGARMGRLLRAENVVQGLVTAAGAGDRIALDATVLSTEQRAGRPVAQAGQLDAIFDLQKAVVFGILDALGIVPTQQEREAIMGNRTGNLVAFIAYGRGLEAMDRGDYADALSHFQEAARLDPGFRAASTQRIEAQRVSAAQDIAVIDELAVAEIGVAQAGAIAQQVIDQVNHSPAAAMTQPVPAAVPPATAPQDRRPASEQQRDSPIGAAARATVIIVIPRPGGQQ